MSDLAAAMAAYLDEVASYINARLGTRRDVSGAEVRAVPGAVREWFKACEAREGWEELCRACGSSFERSGHSKSERMWEYALSNWMRRDGVYFRLLKGDRLNPSDVVSKLNSALDASEERVVFLALLEGVAFAEKRMDFGEWQVVRPTRGELEALLAVSVNEVFYPEAITSVNYLTDHWYLHCEEQAPRRKIGKITLPEEFWKALVRRTYTTFEPIVEKALKSIILWDWQADFLLDAEEKGLREELPADPSDLPKAPGWMPFSVPVVLKIKDNPFERPPRAPDRHRLLDLYEPQVDAMSGEEYEEVRRWDRLDGEETARFVAFVRDTVAALDEIEGTCRAEVWRAVNVGLSYMLKAFFSEGLDQLLWHIASIEALVGEGGSGVEGRLARRVGALYATLPSKRQAALKSFEAVWSLRNKLVHGAGEMPVVHEVHLGVTRALARTAMVEMIGLLRGLARGAQARRPGFKPERRHILGALDARVPLPDEVLEVLQVFPGTDASAGGV
jgi:hypothetical protein